MEVIEKTRWEGDKTVGTESEKKDEERSEKTRQSSNAKLTPELPQQLTAGPFLSQNMENYNPKEGRKRETKRQRTNGVNKFQDDKLNPNISLTKL